MLMTACMTICLAAVARLCPGSNTKEPSIFPNKMKEMLLVHKNVFTNEFLEMNDVGVFIH